MHLFLCGDVMTGRGIDQILPHPGSPKLHESNVQDAREYVALAERVNGPIRRPVDLPYIWGDALDELNRAGVDARVVNLETSVTSSDDAWPGKGIHYRMHPQNIGCIAAAKIDYCGLANNHVLDWGHRGLDETLRTLDRAGIAHAGAGRTAADAERPAVIDLAGQRRLLIFACATGSSGVPRDWEATRDHPGVRLLPNLSADTARGLAAQLRQTRRAGDVAVVSIHWGGNWGYDVPREQVAFAHRLIDGGVDVVHGHSSHHPKAAEVYHGHLILYGCGDFIDDYEGIGGYETFRCDLRLMYLVRLSPADGRLVAARLIPLRTRRLRLERASAEDAKWLRDVLTREGARFGTRLPSADDNSLELSWG
jgi:poly-gamma-glutamate synthesis protein (capsule biosynthesis protein)